MEDAGPRSPAAGPALSRGVFRSGLGSRARQGGGGGGPARLRRGAAQAPVAAEQQEPAGAFPRPPRRDHESAPAFPPPTPRDSQDGGQRRRCGGEGGSRLRRPHGGEVAKASLGSARMR